MPKGSAAWIVAIVSVMVGYRRSPTDHCDGPCDASTFDSALWSSSSKDGTNALKWQVRIWSFVPTAIMVGILFIIWIETRQPT